MVLDIRPLVPLVDFFRPAPVKRSTYPMRNLDYIQATYDAVFLVICFLSPSQFAQHRNIAKLGPIAVLIVVVLYTLFFEN